MNPSQNLRSLAQSASTPQLCGTLRELADQVEALERRAEEAQEMKDAVPTALRERAPVLEGLGWVDAMRRRLEQLEAASREQRGPEGDVRAFHHKFGHPAPSKPGVGWTPELAAFRARLIREEARELVEAVEQGRGLAELAGEACDLLYVTIGTMVAAGLPVQPFWDEVQRANMAKEPNPEGGKPLKPQGWKPPALTEVLARCKSSS